MQAAAGRPAGRGLRHGMGLFTLEDQSVSPRRLYGHQGFAYGAVNGVFFDGEGNGFVSFNSGASEQRVGRLSCLNRDLIGAIPAMKDIVTEIRELRSGVRVTVNDQLTLCMTRKDCKNFPLQEGDTIDVQKWKQELLIAQYPDALNRAVRLLAVRARSTREIEKRLTDACYLDDTVEMVLTKLETSKLLNDEAFAAQWARERMARQIGKARILMELKQKGVDSALAEQAVSALDTEQQDETRRKACGQAAAAVPQHTRCGRAPQGDHGHAAQGIFLRRSETRLTRGGLTIRTNKHTVHLTDRLWEASA